MNAKASMSYMDVRLSDVQVYGDCMIPVMFSGVASEQDTGAAAWIHVISM